jgi:hypothetical protein
MCYIQRLVELTLILKRISSPLSHEAPSKPNASPICNKDIGCAQDVHKRLSLELKIKSQFSPPPYAFGDQKDAPGWVWGFLDAT